MTVKLETRKVPAAACRLTDSDGITFTLLADEDEEDEEDDDESAAEEDDDEDEDDDKAAADDDDGEEDGEPEKAAAHRAWKMLAHTGKVVSRWWGRLVLDMDGARYRQKLALLKDHSTYQPLGYSTKIERTKRGIEAQGRLLQTDLADEVIQFSREGFPWQASLMAVPAKVEELEHGETAEVNGQTVVGPLTIFREWEMHELTLTVLGADDNTETEAFAADGEIEVQFMTKKKNDAPANPPGEPRGAGVQAPPVAAATATEDLDAGSVERNRVSTILRSADAAQMELAQQLVENGTPLAEALTELNKDLRARLNAAASNLRVAAEPISGGNRGDVGDAGETFSFDRLTRDTDPETLSQEWKRHERLRAHFQTENVYLAWAKNQHRCLHVGSDAGVEKLAGGLRAFGHRNVQGNYFLGYQEAMASLWYPRIVTEVPTDQDHEIFKWLGNVPNPAKWTGERIRSTLTDYGVTVLGEKYTSTVDVDVDDLRRDKTGQILKRIAEMGRKTASLPQRLITALLEANGTAYDGAAFFATTHSVGSSGTQSNDITVSGVTPDAPTVAQMETAILAGIQALIGLKDDRGDPMNEDASRFLVLVPTKYMSAAVGAIRNEFTAAGGSNTLVNTGMQIDVKTNARLNGAGAAAGRRFYIFREDAELRSLIWLEEEIPDGFKSQDAYSPQGFWQESVSYGSKRISAVAPGRFELALRVNLAA